SDLTTVPLARQPTGVPALLMLRADHRPTRCPIVRLPGCPSVRPAAHLQVLRPPVQRNVGTELRTATGVPAPRGQVCDRWAPHTGPVPVRTHRAAAWGPGIRASVRA